MDRQLTTRGKERRRQLMELATARFAVNGYHPTSVAEIVEGLGVGKGVFYWYFDSKEELFLEILREAQRDLRRSQKRAISDEADPLRRIEAGIRESLRWSTANRHLFTLVQFAGNEERFVPAVQRGREVAVADTVLHVSEAIERGSIPDQDPHVLAHAVIGVTSHLTQTYVHGPEDAGLSAPLAGTDALADAIVTFCLGGLVGAKAC